MNWVPNRKVVAGFAGGVFAWGMMQLFNLDLPDEIDVAFGTLVASVVAYLIPLPADSPNP